MPRFTDHAGQRLHYRARGQGECLLLVHGLASCGAHWELQARALEAHFRVIIPDLPGCGASTPLPSQCTIAGLAALLWSLLDHLHVARANAVGFSLGGAVALEMALQRPDAVPRLALINSLTAYRIDHWRKWLEARVPPVLIRLIGMRRMACLIAARLFPAPWQSSLRRRAAAVVAEVSPAAYIDLASALEGWTATSRLDRLRSRTLIIAAEHDYTPLAEKMAMAATMQAELVVVRGSRHGTPFDAIATTNACLLALLLDRPLPVAERCVCDGPGNQLAPACQVPVFPAPQHRAQAAIGLSGRALGSARTAHTP